MRHVSRTHSAALDWLFDWIKIDPMIHMKYVDTHDQLADILTKESFTCDKWNRQVRLFNITGESFFTCSHLKMFPFPPSRKHVKTTNADGRGSNARSCEIATCAKFIRVIVSPDFEKDYCSFTFFNFFFENMLEEFIGYTSAKRP